MCSSNHFAPSLVGKQTTDLLLWSCIARTSSLLPSYLLRFLQEPVVGADFQAKHQQSFSLFSLSQVTSQQFLSSSTKAAANYFLLLLLFHNQQPFPGHDLHEQATHIISGLLFSPIEQQ
jgi:hypothetical protein